MRRLIVFALLTFVLGDQTNKPAAEQQADFAKTGCMACGCLSR
jgi:hypothetical protein